MEFRFIFCTAVKIFVASSSATLLDNLASASVPLVGGKLEDVVKKETLQSLDKEYAFNQEWLANH